MPQTERNAEFTPPSERAFCHLSMITDWLACWTYSQFHILSSQQASQPTILHAEQIGFRYNLHTGTNLYSTSCM